MSFFPRTRTTTYYFNHYYFSSLFSLYFYRWVAAESSKYDVERDVHIKEMQIHDLEMEVSDMRGKFILPKLKKVHNFKLMGGEE